jgi:Uma2 family endonuclease
MADTQRISLPNAPTVPVPEGYTRRRFTFDEFWKLWEDGTLEAGEDWRSFELWDGEIVMAPPPGEPHGISNALLYRALFTSLMRLGRDTDFLLIAHGGLRLGEADFVNPDLTVLAPPSGPLGRYPDLSRVLLVAETAASTLRDDLSIKRDAYASAGIPEYWVQDITARRLHVFRDPAGGTYTEHLRLEPGAEVSPLFEPAIRLAVADIF